ncbi:MAG: hypothetical protein E2O74_03445 [Chloroflexi bacterium]|nr:hypothetical protein [Chloroflexota bacterium]MCH8338669.1 hypothetical protein [Chloroflexota bacterium]TDI85452.1 MAG: hypothetical protein E2O74_03445 [Chloroflexota bacterium]
MADVNAVFGTLLALGIVYPGMLIAWSLIFPSFVGKASARIESTPWRCLALGVALAVPIGITALILFEIALGPANFLGGALIVGTLAFASLGASGMAAVMGRRLLSRSNEKTSEAAGFLRGAIALELAAAFPVIGWFLAIPLLSFCSLGAAAFAGLGWMPRGQAVFEGAAVQDAPAVSQV